MSSSSPLDRMILLCRDHVADCLANAEIEWSFRSFRALCISDLPNLLSHSGQTALVTLVALLNRMGMEVSVIIPEVELLAPQPPLVGRYLRESLLKSSEKLMSGATVSADFSRKPDVVFLIGDTQTTRYDTLCWRLTGSDWDGALALDGEHRPSRWTGMLPFGSLVSAALAANEAFKAVVRRLPLRQSQHEEVFRASRSCSWDFGNITFPDNIDLGFVDVISAGAISQAALYTLLRVRDLRLRGRIFDDDLTAVTNLNRNMLTCVSDVDVAKVQVVTSKCQPMLSLEPIATRYGDATDRRELAARVLVGVDDIPSRWLVQQNASGWVGVSGTSHFNISSSAHAAKEPCSGCLHPVDDRDGGALIPTVSFISFWAGLTLAVRLLRDVLALPYPPERQHLWLTPLRMDERHAALWSPVAPRTDCPVHCFSSQGK